MSIYLKQAYDSIQALGKEITMTRLSAGGLGIVFESDNGYNITFEFDDTRILKRVLAEPKGE